MTTDINIIEGWYWCSFPPEVIKLFKNLSGSFFTILLIPVFAVLVLPVVFIALWVLQNRFRPAIKQAAKKSTTESNIEKLRKLNLILETKKDELIKLPMILYPFERLLNKQRADEIWAVDYITEVIDFNNHLASNIEAVRRANTISKQTGKSMTMSSSDFFAELELA